MNHQPADRIASQRTARESRDSLLELGRALARLFGAKDKRLKIKINRCYSEEARGGK